MSIDNRDRFTGRADYYARYRPGYPDGIVDVLREQAAWTPEAVVADIGAGTGISAELFLRHGNRVLAVEPNADMRAVAEGLRPAYPGLEVVDGSAEATGIPDRCADFVVAGTAFHWFDAARSRTEFARILKPGGWTVLMWNTRQPDSTAFLRAYEDLLVRFGTDYRTRWGGKDHGLESRMQSFFGDRIHRAFIENPQDLDLEALRGRLLSSSYAPLESDPSYEPMLNALGEIFARYQRNGTVRFDYMSSVYWGRPTDR